MLKELTIENVAVIEKANISFDTGFTCLTGETGAGKSIIIDSINAIMGDRVSKDIIRSGAGKASIVAVFENVNKDIVKLAHEYDVDLEEECIVSRVISAEGKNSARINGIPVPLSTIKTIFSEAINIHGQHDNQSLLDEAKHLSVLDSFSNDKTCYNEYSVVYEKYADIVSKIKELSNIEKTKQSDLELLQFQVEEIEQADISEEEENQLNEQKKLIKNAEHILSCLNGSYQILTGDDELPGVCSGVEQVYNNMSQISEFSDKMNEIAETLADISDKCQDMMFEIRNAVEDFDVDIGQIDEIEERLNTYYKLKRKYGNSVQDVLEYYESAKEKLDNIEFAQEKLDVLYDEKDKVLKELKIVADRLTEHRKQQFDNLSGKIQESLSFLNMPNVKLYLNITEKDFAYDGQDNIEFYIVTNKGENPKPLAKIASGGELSRIMLAIKSVLAEKECTDTMIFDEVDAGVSGSASLKIGQMLKHTATDHQVFCVTHSPQIAAFADNHLYIEKNIKGNSTFTQVKELSDKERVVEIARIISGENITETSLENAREMISIAKSS